MCTLTSNSQRFSLPLYQTIVEKKLRMCIKFHPRTQEGRTFEPDKIYYFSDQLQLVMNHKRKNNMISYWLQTTPTVKLKESQRKVNFVYLSHTLNDELTINIIVEIKHYIGVSNQDKENYLCTTPTSKYTLLVLCNALVVFRYLSFKKWRGDKNRYEHSSKASNNNKVQTIQLQRT